MKFTGERYVPGVEGSIEVEHLHRYALARTIAPGLDVLDIASGEGYGASLLSEVARSVIGVDIDAGSVAHATETYAAKQNLTFLQGSCTAIPLADGSVDAVVSFETLEHIVEHDDFVVEVARVLRRDGIFLLSTPNKLVYSDEPGYKNPFHLREIYLDDLKRLLSPHFVGVTVFGQQVTAGSLVRPIDGELEGQADLFAGAGGVIGSVDHSGFAPTYFVALCNRSGLGATGLRSSLFLSTRQAAAKVAPELAAPSAFAIPPRSEPKCLEAAVSELWPGPTSEGLFSGFLEVNPSGLDWTAWVVRSDTLAPADFVLVGDNTHTIVVKPQHPRPDAAEHLGSLAAWMCGCVLPGNIVADLDPRTTRAMAVTSGYGASRLPML